MTGCLRAPPNRAGSPCGRNALLSSRHDRYPESGPLLITAGRRGRASFRLVLESGRDSTLHEKTPVPFSSAGRMSSVSELLPGPRATPCGGRLSREDDCVRIRCGSSCRWPNSTEILVHFRLGLRPTFLVNHPDLIRQVLVTDARLFRRSTQILDALRQFDGESLLVSEGEACA